MKKQNFSYWLVCVFRVFSLQSIKVLIYNSDNNYKSKKYRKDSQLLVTDTNRLFYEITRAYIAKDVLGKKRSIALYWLRKQFIKLK